MACPIWTDVSLENPTPDIVIFAPPATEPIQICLTTRFYNLIQFIIPILGEIELITGINLSENVSFCKA